METDIKDSDLRERKKTANERYLKIEGASRYLYMERPDLGHNRRSILNKDTSKILKAEWSPKERDFRSKVWGDDGLQHVLYHREMKVRLTLAQATSIVPDDVEEIEDYPDYVIARHGAVYRLRGNRTKKPTLLAVYRRGNVAYTRLYTPDGRSHNRRTSTLIAKAFGKRAGDWARLTLDSPPLGT